MSTHVLPKDKYSRVDENSMAQAEFSGNLIVETNLHNFYMITEWNVNNGEIEPVKKRLLTKKEVSELTSQ
ncbi:MAG: hypothetical protein ACXAD7_25290 [Candidatus Kariarchaeaceae archaeon]|jgi:hypothetical protein